jgi:DNA-binding transcriptional ArsR family regulator
LVEARHTVGWSDRPHTLALVMAPTHTVPVPSVDGGLPICGRDGPCLVHELSQVTRLSHAALSRHLTLLRVNGVVGAQRDGQHTVYALASPKIAASCDSMREVLCEQAAHQAEIASTLDQPAASPAAECGQ